MTQGGERPNPLQRMRGMFYGWWMVPILGSVMSISNIPVFQALSIWAVALERHFGWSRTQLSLALVFSRVEGGFMGPVEGHLTDRLGTRRVVLMGLLIMGAGLLLFGRVQNLWMFYLAFIVMGLGHGLSGWIPLMTALNNWFRRRRATAIAWTQMSNRAAALLLVPLIAWAVDPDADRFGWEVTATAMGVFVLLVSFPISRLVRNRPEDYGLRPDGDLEEPSPAEAGPGEATPPRIEAEEPDFTVRQALRTRAFWLISFGHAFLSMLMVTILAHLALLLSDQGIGVQMAAWVVVTYTATTMVFQALGGYIGDRVPKRVVLFVFTSIQGLSVLALTLRHSLPMAFVFAVTLGIGFGGRSPATTAIRGDYFGRKAFASILGLSTIPLNIFTLLAPLFAGVYRDRWGSYDLPFNVMGGFCLLGALCFLMAKRPVVPASSTGSGRGGRS